MNSELSFLLIIVFSLVAVFAAGRFGKIWLTACVVILSLISSFTAGKIIEIFGFATSIATPIYAGIFLATDALSEFYGKATAKRAIWVALFGNILLISLGQLIIITPAVANNGLSDALNTIFAFIPRLVAGGLLAFIIAQTIDINLFHLIKERTKGKHLWLRNNVSTIVSQLVDSIIVYVVAFAGIVPNILDLIIVAWVVKILVALIDTPFLYALKKFGIKDQVADVH